MGAVGRNIGLKTGQRLIGQRSVQIKRMLCADSYVYRTYSDKLGITTYK
ncbi:MAG: hypothetical protein RLZZ557_647 [Bacteroidota bacterium]|jgi:hypothetical protein